MTTIKEIKNNTGSTHTHTHVCVIYTYISITTHIYNIYIYYFEYCQYKCKAIRVKNFKKDLGT